MNIQIRHKIIIGIISALFLAGCKVPAIVEHSSRLHTPASFEASPADSMNSGLMNWRVYFNDKTLSDLIDTALKNNQELDIALQEIEIARNDIRFRHGQILPKAEAGIGIGVEKVGRYTSQGAGDKSTEIEPGKEMPELLPDYMPVIRATWELDVWKKLRNAKKAAIQRFLSTAEGRNFVITNLVAEIANSYYELLALDNEMDIVQQTIDLQKNALEVVKVQKQAAAATELAVKKFEAEVLHSQSREYDIQQAIRVTENKINFLLGRFYQPVTRDKNVFNTINPRQVDAGIPSQLLANRPDIRKAEFELAASKLDVKVARAEFYPSFTISSVVGVQAFKPTYLAKLPESVLFSLAGDIAGPLVNKNAIKAEFANANARQLQALYEYEKAILNAYMEVSNELAAISNLKMKYDLKSREANTLTASVEIAGDLFKYARADYLEVLLTQRDALESKLELIETKMQQFGAVANMYKALGGGWK